MTQKIDYKPTNSKGGEMMKKLTLVLALLLVSGAAFAATQTASMDVYSTYSMIGPPIVPITASYPNTPLIMGGAGIDIEWSGNSISRWDAPTQGFIDYLAWEPLQQWSMLLGEGYLVNCTSAGTPSNPTTVVYTGVLDGVPDTVGMTDMWISLPGNQVDGVNAGGWHIISCPFNHAVSFSNDPGDGAHILMTDGNVVRTVMDAMFNEPVWVEFPWTWRSAAGDEAAGFWWEDYLRPGKGYQLKTLVDNLALIIPAYPVYTP